MILARSNELERLGLALTLLSIVGEGVSSKEMNEFMILHTLTLFLASIYVW